jgi:hypothetical protein
MSTTDVTPTTGVAVPSGDGEPRWLGEAETAAWLPLVRLVTLLPQRLDGQLREDAGIGHLYHQILAMLSQARDQQLRAVERIAPGHVVEVRRQVFDRLAPEEVDPLVRIATESLDTASR